MAILPVWIDPSIFNIRLQEKNNLHITKVNNIYNNLQHNYYRLKVFLGLENISVHVHTNNTFLCMYTPTTHFCACTHQQHISVHVHTNNTFLCMYTPTTHFCACTHQQHISVHVHTNNTFLCMYTPTTHF